ncbi:hypothetical protein [Agromyces tardus]|nr:hypothetical protein [Agromyces tardus]
MHPAAEAMNDMHPAAEAIAERRALAAAKEAGDYRVKLRAEEKRSARRLGVALEYAGLLVRQYVATRLTEPAVFDRFVGLEAVVDDDGRLDMVELRVRVDALVRQHPSLGQNADSDARIHA